MFIKLTILSHPNFINFKKINFIDLLGDGTIIYTLSNGNKYFYDEDLKLNYPCNGLMEKIIEEGFYHDIDYFFNKLNKSYAKKDIKITLDWFKKIEKLKKDQPKIQLMPRPTVTETMIKEFLFSVGLRQLILSVTEDCNFRCSYCIFSSNYPDSREHNENYMTFETAKKAIKNYLSLIKEGASFNPPRKPNIGFYGGEALLNFNLIKKCVDYSLSISEDCIFTMTTNGSLLDVKIADYLIENKFKIVISLDGPKEEHDRCRIDENNNGTFDKIMKNINYIFNEKKYKEVYVLPVFDFKTNFKKANEFFKNDKIPFISQVSQVDFELNNTYYSQFSEEDYKKYVFEKDCLEKKYFQFQSSENNLSKKNKPEYFDFLFNFAENSIFGESMLFYKSNIIPYTGTCVPGEKIFVNPNGEYHICEKVLETLSIGNVNEGLDFKKIVVLINDYMNNMEKCEECSILGVCKKCFKDFITKDKLLSPEDVCDFEEEKYMEDLKISFSYAEQNPNLIRSYNKKYLKLKKAEENDVF